MAMMVLRTCQQVEGGLPANVKSKMMINIVLDFAIGLVPFLGDVASAFFRANTRNAVVLEKYLREKGAKALKAQGHAPPALDPTDPDEYDQQMREEVGPPPQYTTAPPTRQGTQSHHGNGRSTHPQQDRVPEERGGGWFSKKRQQDVERGDSVRRQDGPLPHLPDGEPCRNKSTLQKNRY
jgi:hypothetical protein